MAPGSPLPLRKGATPPAPTPIRRYAVPTHHNSPSYAPDGDMYHLTEEESTKESNPVLNRKLRIALLHCAL